MDEQEEYSLTEQPGATDIEIDDGIPEVTSSRKSRILMIAAFVVVAIVVVYLFVFKGGDKTPKVSDKAAEKIVIKDSGSPTVKESPIGELIKEIPDEYITEQPELPDVPELPELQVEKLQIPTSIIVPVKEVVVEEEEEDTGPITQRTPPVAKPADPIPSPATKDVNESGSVITDIRKNRALADRRGTNMFLKSASGGPSGESLEKKSIIVINKNSIDALVGNTEVVQATRIVNMAQTVAQGKIISAVLETAINTDLPGTLRAIVSRDVYAESGKNILIPKGSRLIGTYDSGVSRGQVRVAVGWNRIIRPDGVDIAVASPATDQFGRTGLEGEVDNKYTEILTSSLLSSMITIGSVYLAEKMTDSKGTSESTDNSTNITTSNLTATDSALLDAAGDLTDTASDIVDEWANVKPTIRVPQGTRVNVFVNHDLVLPAIKKLSTSGGGN